MTALGSYLYPYCGTADKDTGFIFLSYPNSLRQLGCSHHILQRKKEYLLTETCYESPPGLRSNT